MTAIETRPAAARRGRDAAGLSVRGLHAAFGRHVVLRDVSLDVAPGETLVLFGPSGAGKTVMLRAIAGLETSAAGQVLVDGRDVSGFGPEARGMGMAFQNFALYPHMPARENIASPLRARGLARREIEDRVRRIAELLRIAHVLEHAPRELSNGQKQRTALARALVAEPGVLLLDDPLRNVDAKLRYEMRLELPRLLRRAGAATIYVTQDYREAMALGDRIAVLDATAIAQCDEPSVVYDAPVSVAVAKLFGDPPVNLLPCRPQPHPDGVLAETAGLRIALPGRHAAAGRDCLLGLRPETLGVAPAGDGPRARDQGVRATVVARTPLHERVVVLLRMAGGEELLASLAGGAPPEGSAVTVRADAARALLFDAATGRRVSSAGAAAEAVA